MEDITLDKMFEKIRRLRASLNKDPTNKQDLFNLVMTSSFISFKYLDDIRKDSGNVLCNRIKEFNANVIKLVHKHIQDRFKSLDVRLITLPIGIKLDVYTENYECSIALPLDKMYLEDGGIKSYSFVELMVTNRQSKKFLYRKEFGLPDIYKFSVAPVDFQHEVFDVKDFSELDSVLSKLN